MMSLIASVVYCAVGCNTGSPDKQSLHILECDTKTGAAKIVQSVKGIQGTTYFEFDRERRFLYSVIGENRDGKALSAVVKFSVKDNRLGEMVRVADLPCEAPCHVSLTPDGKRVAFAAYSSATCGTVGIDGKGLKTFRFPDDAMGPNQKRQQKAFAHQTFHLPADVNRPAKLGVVDLGCDRIWFFDPETMERCESLSIKAEPGDGPRHAIFSKDGRQLFVLCELGSCVCSFLRSPAPCDCSFQRLGRWSMLPEGYDRWAADGETLVTKAAAIKISADGKTLMASNRGYDSIAFYDIDRCGRLTLKNIAKLRGKFPRDFELMPGEKFMVVGHKMSDEIQVYAVDMKKGTLEPVGFPIAAWRPLCFKFL